MNTQVEPTVRQFVIDNFLYQAGLDTLNDNDSFLGKGIVDSTGVLELVQFLEDTYSIQVGVDELVPENLDSVSQISAYVQRKLQSGAGMSHAA